MVMKPLRMTILVVIALSFLGGCGWFRKDSGYERSVESRPLEIPPDLDSPASGTDLAIPAAAGASSSTSASSASAPARPATELSDSGIRINDSADAAYRRVGIALERSAVGAVLARDPAARSYTLEVTTSSERKASGGWLRRTFSGKKVRTSVERLVVRVVEDGAASQVRIEDEAGATRDDAAAERVLGAIRERLG